MKRFFCFFLFWPMSLFAHLGSPTVVADGVAGPYPLRVVVRPANVIPGRAQIDVRFLRPVPDQTIVTVLPVSAAAGLRGAPRPDEATSVPGDRSVRHGELWLMTSGAYSVHVTVHGPEGAGTFIVPLDAVATGELPMPTATKIALVVLGSVLFAGAVSLAAAAAKESTLDPHQPVGPRDRWRGLAVGVGATVFFGGLLYGGNTWWSKSDRWYRNNEIYKPVPLTASVSRTQNGHRVLELAIDGPGLSPDESLTVLPDHGKLMHLFMMRQPHSDVFAHLHPIQRAPGHFAADLPSLPAGNYTLYADITTSLGFAATLTTQLTLPSAIRGQSTSTEPESSFSVTGPPADPDDAWIGPAAPSPDDKIGAKLEQVGEKTVYAGKPLSLDFRAVDSRFQPVESEPYMGMLGHAAIRKNDGTVFAHLHPLGTISMAAQSFFATQAAQQTSGAVGQLPELCEAGINVSFPYEFPSAGAYRLWVQTRVKGQILTGVFDLNVLP